MSTQDIFEELFKEQLKLMKKWMEAMQKQWEETLKMLNCLTQRSLRSWLRKGRQTPSTMHSIYK